MVAVIRTSTNIRRALQYNEQKLKDHRAVLIHAEGFAKDLDDLHFLDKLKHFEKFTERNTRTKVNSVHISLNFDPSEKLSPETLKQIAETYLTKIGFEGQPYLVYEHHDSGHPHIHLVTTNIKRNGKRIALHNIGRNQSETARVEIEKLFNLVPAQGRTIKEVNAIRPVNIQKAQYGKTDTKRAMTNILDAILTKYNYTSLPELNAVLREYNMIADRGEKDSRVYKNRGLIYRVLNEKGEKIGVPIKASDFYSNPTLSFLEKQFSRNEAQREPLKKRIKNTVDLAMFGKAANSLTELEEALQSKQINLVIRQNDKGIVYGLTYVDHYNKCVINGSDLGKAYSASGLLARLNQKQLADESVTITKTQEQKAQTDEKSVSQSKTLEEILGPEKDAGINPMLKQDDRKKRKRLRR